MQAFATIVYGWTLLTAIITKSSAVDLAEYPRYNSSLVTKKRSKFFHKNLELCQQKYFKTEVVGNGPTQDTFLKSQGSLFFTYFWHIKITNRDFKKVSWIGPFPTTKDIIEIII